MRPTDATLRRIEDHFDLQETSFKTTRLVEPDSPAFIFQTGVAEGYHQASMHVANARKLVASMVDPASFPLEALELNADLAELINFAIHHDLPRVPDDEEAELREALEKVELRDAVYYLAMNWICGEYQSWLESDMAHNHSFVHLVRLLKEFTQCR